MIKSTLLSLLFFLVASHSPASELSAEHKDNPLKKFTISGLKISDLERKKLEKPIGKIEGKWKGSVNGVSVNLYADSDKPYFEFETIAGESDRFTRSSRVIAKLSRRGSIISIDELSCLLQADKTTSILKSNGCSILGDKSLFKINKNTDNLIIIDTGSGLLELKKRRFKKAVNQDSD